MPADKASLHRWYSVVMLNALLYYTLRPYIITYNNSVNEQFVILVLLCVVCVCVGTIRKYKLINYLSQKLGLKRTNNKTQIGNT